jgi:hypothetical protein
MKLGSADPGVERAEFVDRGLLLDEAFCECLAVALLGVLVGVSWRWGNEVRALLDSSGVALSVFSSTFSLSELSKSASLPASLAVCIEGPSSEE